ncbi:uncharacterized protein METZ01_LOCUS489584 [marine metagenome]|uniref:Uncharacterized protein n=1 Tax=marine metagenome TaxID=408172 RepID=A0A383CXF5_9ZZZZ
MILIFIAALCAPACAISAPTPASVTEFGLPDSAVFCA